MIDSHLHVVDPSSAGPDRSGHPDGAWWESVDAAPRSVAARLADAGVGAGVLVQAVGAHGFDNRFVLRAAAALGPRFVAVAAVGEGDPDPVSTLERAAAAGATGARLFSIPRPAVGWLGAERGRVLAACCRELGLTPSICCFPDELGAAAALVAAEPEVEFAIEHAGFVSIGGDEGDLARLVELDNVVIKVSTGALDHSALEPGATVARLVALVGADRLAWGSDHPQVRDRDYATLADLGRSAVAAADLGESASHAILEGTAGRLWLR